MGRRKSPPEAVLTDSTNSAASAQTHVGEDSSQGRQAGKGRTCHLFQEDQGTSAACEGAALAVATVVGPAVVVSLLSAGMKAARAVQVASKEVSSTKENAEHTPSSLFYKSYHSRDSLAHFDRLPDSHF